jgi:RNase P subunit RPR2
MEEKDLSVEDMKRLEEEKLEINAEAFEVNQGLCKDCNEKLIKVVENKNLLDGAITFHIIKLKCLKCGKEYLDLGQAEKYDFLLALEKAFNQPLDTLSRKILS